MLLTAPDQKVGAIFMPKRAEKEKEMKGNELRKRVAIIATCGLLAFPCVAQAGNGLTRYKRIAAKLDVVRVVDSSELTAKMLRKRAKNGTIYIEEIYGIVLDGEGNGEILNAANADYSYISYADVNGAEKGDVILTYLIYNPDTSYTDDVIARFDYIIDKGN